MIQNYSEKMIRYFIYKYKFIAMNFLKIDIYRKYFSADCSLQVNTKPED